MQTLAPAQTVIDILRQRSQEQPSGGAYTYLGDGEITSGSLTYLALLECSQGVAALLSERCRAGDRALLAYPPGLDFIVAFYGCLLAGVVAVPVPVSSNHRALSRLASIVLDSQASTILTVQSALAPLKAALSEMPIAVLATDAIAEGAGQGFTPASLEADEIAFLQYTSGSTSLPKGVMVSHRNLVYNARSIRASVDGEAVSLTWLPHFHDMGLVDGLIYPLVAGVPSVVMSPVAFLQRPIRWLKAVSNFRATHSGGPNFAFELCIRKVTPEQREGLDLSSWTTAYNGAEPVRPSTLRRFIEAFEACGFRPDRMKPVYGLAEATLYVTGRPPGQGAKYLVVDEALLGQDRVSPQASEGPGTKTLVSVGPPWLDTRLAIVDPNSLEPVPEGRIGEIWIGGPTVARGYWGLPDESRETFGVRLAGSDEGPFLRTGDLGFLHEGELYVTGRIKDLLIIRGRNYYPQDIELTVEQSHPAVRLGSVAAFIVADEEDDQLVVLAEVERRLTGRQSEGNLRAMAERMDTFHPVEEPMDVESITSAIRQAVAENHELHVHRVLLLGATSIPKTSSGKIQRHACRQRLMDGSLPILGEG